LTKARRSKTAISDHVFAPTTWQFSAATINGSPLGGLSVERWFWPDGLT
jgi:hypothetical protein